MPCRTEEPTATEEYNQRTAKLYVYVCEKLRRTLSASAYSAANAAFCGTDFTPYLCKLLKNMSVDQMTNIVYNPHSKESRALADWWEQHQEDDKLHAKIVADGKKRQKLQAQALKKLTVEERKALGF